MTEIWKDIPEFEGSYQVSNLGKVRSLTREVPHSIPGFTRTYTGQPLKQQIDKNGYMTCTLWTDGKPFTASIARCVALAFIPNPESKPEVNHKNGIRAQNDTDNLEWNTISENRKHAFEVLKRKVGNERPVQAVNSNGEKLYFESIRGAYKAGFNRNSIYACLQGKYRHHRGFLWSYCNG